MITFVLALISTLSTSIVAQDSAEVVCTGIYELSSWSNVELIKRGDRPFTTSRYIRCLYRPSTSSFRPYVDLSNS
ncbi:hypothetical protein PNOK_0000500 [Pyrrhoderma noxium]|uniref:Uncharacterized protein n=1 Tax=Pyrrhoderma noxium TaxID=2282107 RepID=A0A286UTP3_9AGAM|nr:hypothetical protein PNOK_0000500 [Pyrrhoderma noxium]